MLKTFKNFVVSNAFMLVQIVVSVIVAIVSSSAMHLLDSYYDFICYELLSVLYFVALIMIGWGISSIVTLKSAVNDRYNIIIAGSIFTILAIFIPFENSCIKLVILGYALESTLNIVKLIPSIIKLRRLYRLPYGQCVPVLYKDANISNERSYIKRIEKNKFELVRNYAGYSDRTYTLPISIYKIANFYKMDKI